MTINEGQYCHVDTTGVDFVDQGPKWLPQNWVTSDGATQANINNSDNWTDPMLAGIDWLPYVLTDAGAPDDGKSYNRTLSDFVIGATTVTQTAIYTEFTQEEYDLTASTTITESQQEAESLARQTEAILQEDNTRVQTGRLPKLSDTEKPVVEEYLGTLYDAVDDPVILPNLPPGATRQRTIVTNENRDRAVIRRSHVEFSGFNYYEIQYTLYTTKDATGMSLWVADQPGAPGDYLFTLPLVDQGNNVWYVSTDRTAGMPNKDAFTVALWKGQKISQNIDLPVWDDPIYPLYLDVRWNNGDGPEARGNSGGNRNNS